MFGAIAKNSIKTSALLVVRVLTQAFTLILLTRLLGAHVYGDFIALATLAVVMNTISTLGTGYLMVMWQPKREDAVAYVWRFAWPTTLLVGHLLLIVYYCLTDIYFTSKIISPMYVVLLGFSELVLTPLIILFSFALQAKNKVPLSQFIQWLPLGLKVLAAYACYFVQGDTLAVYIELQAASTILALFFSFIIVNRKIRLNWSFRVPSLWEIRQGFRYSSMSLSNMSSSEIDKIMVVNSLGAQDTSSYSTCSRIVNAIITPVTGLLLSAQSRLLSNKSEKKESTFKLIKALFLITLLWGGAGTLFLSYSSSYIASFFGQGFENIKEIMGWLAFLSIPLALRRAAGSILMSFEYPLTRVLCELLGLVLFICLVVFIIPKNGVVGYVASAILSEVCIALMSWFFVYHYIFSRRKN